MGPDVWPDAIGRVWVPLMIGGLLELLILAACAGSDPAPTVEIQTATQPSNPASATATWTESATASSTATIGATPTNSVTPSPVPTSTSTSTATPAPTPTATSTPLPPTPTVPEGAVVITAILSDPPVARDAEGEMVTIVNNGAAPVDMTGWTLSDIAEHVYIFPSFVLEPGASVVVHICTGEEDAGNLYWGQCSAIWNNDGDTAYLRDATGRDIATFSY